MESIEKNIALTMELFHKWVMEAQKDEALPLEKIKVATGAKSETAPICLMIQAFYGGLSMGLELFDAIENGR